MTPVFFTDRDLGKQFPAVLVAAGITVETHASHFPPATPDEEWLRVVGKRGWVAITHDRRIRYKPNELAAVIEHKAALLVVVGKASLPELADSFVASYARIERFVAEHHAPYIAKVYRASTADLSRNPRAPGRVEQWFP